uniref:Inner centromere protein ARK-binding domain-containing protein n=1 Tax=Daphnia galeata TaxID=27404 RepID=A0A8J2RJH7_9CRUS|nr:unnamed protein product [Daphnia galeata]
MSFQKAFEDEFMRENSEVFKHVIAKMIEIWKQLGVPEVEIQERVIAATSQNKVKSNGDLCLREKKRYQKEILSSIDRLARQHHQLCEELGTPYLQFGEEIPLLEKGKLLQKTVVGLNKEKEDRMRSVQALFQEEDVLCERLNVERCALNIGPQTEDLRTKYVTHQDSDILPVANNKQPKPESNRPPLRQLLTEKENKQKPIRQGNAGKGKATSTPKNQALPRAYVVLRPLTTEEIEAWSGRHKDKTTRQDEAEKAEASAAVAVPVAGPSSLNTTVSLPSSPEFLATKKGKKLPNLDNYDIGDLRWDDSTEEATMPNKSIPNWARSVNLKVALNEQANKDIDTESLYPAEELLRDPNLNEIFKIKRDRFDKRTSSAVWKTPPSNYM